MRAGASILTALLLALGTPAPSWARGGGPAPNAAPPGAAIRDVATRLSTPVSADHSLVVTAPAHFWVECPRWLPVATALQGQGLTAQHVSPTGGTHALLYVGSVPLGAAYADDGPDARAERAASDFLTALPAAYERMNFRLTNGPVPAKRGTHKLGGRKQTVWRGGPYATQPAGEGVRGPDAPFSGECLLFRPVGTEVLAYVVFDVKLGAATFAQVLEGLAVVPTRQVHPQGGPVQLNNLFEAHDGSYPVRLLAYDRPPGFAFAQTAEDASGRLVYGEERFDERGEVSATHRLRQEDTDRARSLAEEAEGVRSHVGRGEAGALREVALGSARAAAFVFEHPGSLAGKDGRAFSAVFRHEDKLLTFTWTTRDEPALVKQDAALFERLVASIQVSVRTRR
jgi:hypothetical protein